MLEKWQYLPSKVGSSLVHSSLEGQEVLVGYGAPFRKGRSIQRFKFLLHPAHSHTEGQASAGENVQRRQDFGRQQWIAVGDDHHAGNQADAGGNAGQVGKEGQLLQVLDGVPAVKPPVGGIGVRRVYLPGHEDMVAGHHAIETQFVTLPGDGRQGLGPGRGAAVGQIESESHCGLRMKLYHNHNAQELGCPLTGSCQTRLNDENGPARLAGLSSPAENGPRRQKRV